MSSLLILEAFFGYPDGKKRLFTAGEMVDPEDVGEEFATLIITKGHAKRAGEEEVLHAESFDSEGRSPRGRGRVGK